MLKNKRYDVRTQRLGCMRVAVYWRDDAFGKGPCLSLYVGSREKARFDLFEGSAHKHLARDAKRQRHYYPKGLTMAEYIDQAVADMVGEHPSARRAAGWARQELAELYSTRQTAIPSMSISAA